MTITEAALHTAGAVLHRQPEAQATRAGHHTAEVHQADFPAVDIAEAVPEHHAAAAVAEQEDKCNFNISYHEKDGNFIFIDGSGSGDICSDRL